MKAGVAILMRTRDRPVLLARALASVLSQSHGDWHLVLVNDGGDPEPVERLAARHDTAFDGRLTLIHRRDGDGGSLNKGAASGGRLGMEAASNAAFAAIPGAGFHYVAVHDDDDSWHPQFLARTTRYLDDPRHCGCAAVLTHWTVVSERLEADGVVEDRREPGPFTADVVEFGEMLARNRFPPISLLTRRDVADRLGQGSAGAGPFNPSLPVLGDWDFNLRVLQAGEIGVVAEPLAFYHHRQPDDLPGYVNSASEPGDPHARTQTLYRNSRLRALGAGQPEALALVHVLGRQAERYHEQAEALHQRMLANLDRNGLWGHHRHEDLQHRLIRAEQVQAGMLAQLAAMSVQLESIRASADATGRALDRIRRIWNRLLPMRRMISRFRRRPHLRPPG